MRRPARTPAPRSRFRDELVDFLRFLRRPRLGPRLPGRSARAGVWEDWFGGPGLLRLLQWALLLWLLNLFIFGPLAVSVAQAAGAQHRIRFDSLPWVQALLWAPLVEELVFRHGLRRWATLWWLVPLSVCVLFMGPGPWAYALLALILLLAWWPGWFGANWQPQGLPARLARLWRMPWRWRRSGRRGFPWLFHAAALVFAALHLHNFSLPAMPLYWLPLLVLPQWVTGLVLGWLRLRRGLGAAIALHAIFNAGPLLMVWLVLTLAPDMAPGLVDG